MESGGALRLNATYYLSKVIIPALHRLFTLVGADIWVRPLGNLRSYVGDVLALWYIASSFVLRSACSPFKF